MTSSARRVTRLRVKAAGTDPAGPWSSRIASGTARSVSSSSETRATNAERRASGAARRRGAFEIFRLATGVGARG